MAATGSMPCLAIPAAMATVCASAMPVSKKRSGKRFSNPERPVPSAMAAVRAAMRPSQPAMRSSSRPKMFEKVSPPFLSTPVTGS